MFSTAFLHLLHPLLAPHPPLPSPSLSNSVSLSLSLSLHSLSPPLSLSLSLSFTGLERQYYIQKRTLGQFPPIIILMRVSLQRLCIRFSILTFAPLFSPIQRYISTTGYVFISPIQDWRARGETHTESCSLGDENTFASSILTYHRIFLFQCVFFRIVFNNMWNFTRFQSFDNTTSLIYRSILPHNPTSQLSATSHRQRVQRSNLLRSK